MGRGDRALSESCLKRQALDSYMAVQRVMPRAY